MNRKIASGCSYTPTLAFSDQPMKANSNAETAEVKDEESAHEHAVDARIERALSQFFRGQKGEYGDETYRVVSGSGKTYAVDLNGPDGYHCSCADPATFCKHILYIVVVERPGYLLECKHGHEWCPGIEAIPIDGVSIECDGQVLCFECFMDAPIDDERDISATEARA